MATASNSKPATDIIEQLTALLGASQVELDLDKRTFFAADMSRPGPAAIAVIRPDTSELVAEAVKLCVDRGVAAVPRGGGFSYTGGYVPDEADSVIVDMRSLAQIEINAEDMYVVAGAGVTWHQLYEALKAQGLRTPYFGPMSGYGATVGGALSQGSFFLGSSQYGPVADSVLGVEVALADGTLLRTGSWGGTDGASPFMRSYGPDLTGLFLNDTGALGFKTRAVLKLIPFPAHTAFASFVFAGEEDAIAAVNAIGSTGIPSECYCWDPYFVKLMASATVSIAEDLKILAGVAKGGGSRLRGLFNAGRLAAAGKRAFDGQLFMLNLTADDVTLAGAEGRMAVLKQLAEKAGGREMTASAPMAMRGTPFIEFNTTERRRPLRNLPVHGLVPHSRVAVVSRDVRAVLAERGNALLAEGIEVGLIYFGVGVQAVCIEPIFYWTDERHFQHDRVAERSNLAALDAQPDEPAATKLVMETRKALVELFTRHGSAHVQIGKSYPWLQGRSPNVAATMRQIKQILDPKRRVNPGSLGL